MDLTITSPHKVHEQFDIKYGFNLIDYEYRK